MCRKMVFFSIPLTTETSIKNLTAVTDKSGGRCLLFLDYRKKNRHFFCIVPAKL